MTCSLVNYQDSDGHDMYRFVSARHVLLNSSLDMSVYLINVYICMKDDKKIKKLGKLKENCLLLKLYRKLRKMFLSPRRESNLLISGETL